MGTAKKPWRKKCYRKTGAKLPACNRWIYISNSCTGNAIRKHTSMSPQALTKIPNTFLSCWINLKYFFLEIIDHLYANYITLIHIQSIPTWVYENICMHTRTHARTNKHTYVRTHINTYIFCSGSIEFIFWKSADVISIRFIIFHFESQIIQKIVNHSFRCNRSS